jgi:hypothetical protein
MGLRLFQGKTRSRTCLDTGRDFSGRCSERIRRIPEFQPSTPPRKSSHGVLWPRVLLAPVRSYRSCLAAAEAGRRHRRAPKVRLPDWSDVATAMSKHASFPVARISAGGHATPEPEPVKMGNAAKQLTATRSVRGLRVARVGPKQRQITRTPYRAGHHSAWSSIEARWVVAGQVIRQASRINLPVPLSTIGRLRRFS